MRSSPLIFALVLVGCVERSVSGEASATTAGTTAPGSTAGGSSGSSIGGVSTSGGRGTSGSGTSGGSTSGTSASSSGSTTSPAILAEGPCGPGTLWLGDTCITASCAYPVGAGQSAECQLPDGGVGQCSGGVCIAADDRLNCGGLGEVCPDPALCFDGVCDFFPRSGGFQDPCYAVGCSGPNQICGFSITGGTCVDYACSQDGPACIDGGFLGFCCGGTCALLGPENCGGCGIRCPSGTACAGSVCNPVQTCGPDTWPPNAACALPNGAVGTCCLSRCVESNAGCAFVSCVGAPDGTGCPFGDAGERGACHSGACYSLDDPAHCGPAGFACAPGEICPYGGGDCRPPDDCRQAISLYSICMTDAGALGSCCGDACVVLSSDARNCGWCGYACPAGSACGEFRRDTACVLDGGLAHCSSDSDCPAGSSCMGTTCLTTTCDRSGLPCSLDGGLGTCCGDSCSPAGLDCGASCPPGTSQRLGYTGCAANPADFEGNACVDGGAGCPPGTICDPSFSECIPLDVCAAVGPDSTGANCPFGLNPGGPGSCCGATCTDTSQDPSNCFGCGMACPSGICLPLYQLADGPLQCLPAAPTGDCDVSCGTGTACLGGHCVDGACDTSTSPFCLAENGTIGVCCGDGSCAHPLDDAQNCGFCGNHCGSGGACVNGSCTDFPGCGLGRMSAFCNLDAGTSFLCCPGAGCTDVRGDSRNCGACGVACPEPTWTCTNGQCVSPK